MADHWARVRNIWYLMKHRTGNPDHPDYHRYGARGIEVCDEWHDQEQFIADMLPTYKPGLTLDRIDNDGPYSPDNCRWVDRKKQANNRRTSRFFTINGETKTLAEWCDQSPLKNSTIRQRLYGYKWPIERALGLS